MTIIVEYVYPPIPDRSHDYIAHIDDYGEDSPQGHGSTPWEALHQIADLLQEQAEAHVVNSAVESARERQTGQREG